MALAGHLDAWGLNGLPRALGDISDISGFSFVTRLNYRYCLMQSK